MDDLFSVDEEHFSWLCGEAESMLSVARNFEAWEDPICSVNLNRLKELKIELSILILHDISKHNRRVGVVNDLSDGILRLESLKKGINQGI